MLTIFGYYFDNMLTIIHTHIHTHRHTHADTHTQTYTQTHTQLFYRRSPHDNLYHGATRMNKTQRKKTNVREASNVVTTKAKWKDDKAEKIKQAQQRTERDPLHVKRICYPCMKGKKRRTKWGPLHAYTNICASCGWKEMKYKLLNVVAAVQNFGHEHRPLICVHVDRNAKFWSRRHLHAMEYFPNHSKQPRRRMRG